MALIHIFGETPVVKIMDFLIDHRGYEYSKTEIAENSNIEWITLNRKLLELDHEAAMYMSEKIAEKEMAGEKVHKVEVEAIKIHG